MLGETFEMVTDDFVFLAEKVLHTPKPVNVSYLKGKHFMSMQNEGA